MNKSGVFWFGFLSKPFGPFISGVTKYVETVARFAYTMHYDEECLQ